MDRPVEGESPVVAMLRTQPDPIPYFKKAYPTTYRFAVRNGYERDDLTQLCWLAACEAALKWDPARGAGFRTYATEAMRNCISNEVRKSLAWKRTPTGGRMIFSDWKFLEQESRDKPVDERDELPKQFFMVFDRTNKFGRAVIECRYGLNGRVQMSQRKTARHLNALRSSVVHAEHKFFTRLSRVLK